MEPRKAKEALRDLAQPWLGVKGDGDRAGSGEPSLGAENCPQNPGREGDGREMGVNCCPNTRVENHDADLFKAIKTG